MEQCEPSLDAKAGKLTDDEKQMRVAGPIILGFLIKHKRMISGVIVLAILTAIALTYLVLI